VESSSEQSYPFAHACTPQAGPRLSCIDIEPDPVVSHRKQQTAFLECEAHGCNTRPGVTRDVSQRLLRNPKDAQSDIMGQPVGYLLNFHLDLDGLASRNMLAFCFQRFGQAQIVENRRMETIRKSMHIFAQAHQLAVYGPRCVAMCVWLNGFESSRVDCKARRSLSNIVMQFAGESLSLILVCRKQAPAQLLARLFRLLAVGYVQNQAHDPRAFAAFGVLQYLRVSPLLRKEFAPFDNRVTFSRPELLSRRGANDW